MSRLFWRGRLSSLPGLQALPSRCASTASDARGVAHSSWIAWSASNSRWLVAYGLQ